MVAKSNRLLSEEQLGKTEEYLTEVIRLARESKTHLTNLRVGDLESVLKQFQALRRERKPSESNSQ